MTRLQKSLLRINELFSHFRRSIENDTAMGLFDKNRLSEDILVPIFREVYGYKKLENLNKKGGNFPGIDLGDAKAKIAFQITSDPSSSKIKKTLEKIVSHKHYKRYNHFVIYVITQKQAKYSGVGWEKIYQGKFRFLKNDDIRDYTDLLREISRLPLSKVQKIEAILEEHFGENKRIPTKEIVEEHLKRQLQKEINSKKYIPDIFVEIAKVKDQARYFSVPSIFIRKVLDDINDLNFDEINLLLKKVSLPIIPSPDKRTLSSLVHGKNLKDTVNLILDYLTEIKNRLQVYASRQPLNYTLDYVPEDKKYIYKDMKYALETTSYFVLTKVEDLIEAIGLISSRVLFLISRAGQGKTNFVCDFSQTVLQKRGVPCVFFSGRDFNYTAPEKMDEYFVKALFGTRVKNLHEALEELNKLAEDLDAPLVIIIDGINEHKNIKQFSHYLEKFIESALIFSNIRFILTCRSEYFEDRFSNFNTASFFGEIRFISSLETRMETKHREKLLRGYFKFFGIQVGYITDRAKNILESDVLLLRMFCESFEDKSSKAVAMQIFDIYREKVFREYLEKKVRDLTEATEDNTNIKIRRENKYRAALRWIVELMIERQQYANILISDIPVEYDGAISGLLSEDVIIRKDLISTGSVLRENVEVINFTFDEFRDFLIANHLVSNLFVQDSGKFEDFIDNALSERAVISEGIRTYLFYASRHPQSKLIAGVIEKKEWYKDIFIRCIFSVEEEYISDEDIAEIKKKFFEDGRTASWILRMLVWRWRVSVYPKLNINLLFEILKQIDRETFTELILPGFIGYGIYGYDGTRSWQINQLTEDVEESIEDNVLDVNSDFINIIELLIYLFPVWSAEHSSTITPAFRAFSKFSNKYPSLAYSLLRKHVKNVNLSVRYYVWKMFSYLKDSNVDMTDAIDEACSLLSEIPDETEDWHINSLAIEITRFLEKAIQNKKVKLDNSILIKMKKHTLFTLAYGDVDDNRD